MKTFRFVVSLLVVFGFCLVNPVSPEQNQILNRAIDSSSPVRSPSWTFMVYLDGDNNLEGVGIDDFLEMASVGSTADVNIVVQFDRIAGYDSSYEDWTGTKRFYVTPGMTPTPANALMGLGELNMGDPATLVDFVNWAKTNYPATNYALILWNHGGGWRKSKEELWKERMKGKKEDIIFKAVCWDDTNGGDCLYMDEVQGALNTSGGANLIGFDACLMGMVEVAYEVKNYGQVMVGSEELEPGNGWPYDLIMTDLTANPSWTPSQLGSAIVDRYYQSYGNDNTQSAIDLTRMNTLASTISTFAQTMINQWDTDQTAVRNAAQDVMAEITSTVINEKHGPWWPGANGLAIYFPEYIWDFNPDYNGTIIDFPNDTQWEEFLLEFYSSMGGSWIDTARIASQQFDYFAFPPVHIDLYHFCELISAVPGDYYTESQVPHEYGGGGTAQGLQCDDCYTTYPLPFDFPYFGETIAAGTDIYISSNGYVDLSNDSYHDDYSNSVSELAGSKRIAPCWADLLTYGIAQPGEDVYITENVDNLVIRWVAETYAESIPGQLAFPEIVNVELVLFQDGRIRFNYNGGNGDISPWGIPPTIGISKGDSVNYYLSVYNGQSALRNVDSDLFTPTSLSLLTVTYPNGGEKLQIGSEINITWDAQGVGDLKITLWKDGVKLGTIADNVSPSPGSYAWTVGNYIGGSASPGTGYTIKISEKGTSVSDTSDSSFDIIDLTVTSPDGGEDWLIGSAHNITWTAQGVGDLKITLWKDGVKLGTIADNVSPSPGSYAWTVGNYIGGPASPGTGYTIKISEKGTSVSDTSNAPFNITEGKVLTVTSPNGGEEWLIGSPHVITWDAQGVGYLKITLWKDGVKLGTIADNVSPSPGSYAWTAGNYIGGTASPGTGYTIKISEKGTSVFDISDNSFSLKY